MIVKLNDFLDFVLRFTPHAGKACSFKRYIR